MILRTQPSIIKQSGIGLLILMSILLVGVSALLITALSTGQLTTEARNKTASKLFQAQRALLGWSLAHSTYPGMMPYPDTRLDSNYDGSSDCPQLPINNTDLIGKIPWLGQTTPCPAPLHGLGTRYTDNSGQVIWYAVSKNLLYNVNSKSYPSINSEIKSISTNWISIIDSNGNTVSNRVAFVVIAPGRALSYQNRSGAAPTQSQFLDSVTINGTTYSNANSNQRFVISGRSDTFNDILSYITIDDFIKLVETRVLRDLKQCLDNYALGSGGSYPLPIAMDTGGGNGGGTGNATGNGNGTGNATGNGNGKGKGNATGKGTGNATGNGTGNGGGSALSNFGRFDSNNTSWPNNCILKTSYWQNWTDSAFYQVAPAYVPNADLKCPQCIQLNNSGKYFAMILLAGQKLASQNRLSALDKKEIKNYLENDNATTTDYSYESATESNSFNDRLICVDANNVCK